MSYKFGERSKNNLIGVHPDLVRLMCASITDSPVDFTITEGVRTAERQQALFAQGRTTSGSIVTNKDGVYKKSNHQVKADGFGYAVDLYPFFLGKVQVNHKDTVKCLTQIANHIKAKANELGIKIVWGGDWKMKDYPHFELNINE